MHFDFEVVLRGKLADAGKRSLNCFDDGGDLYTRVGADKMDFFGPFLWRDSQNCIHDKRSYQGAVFATTETDQPRAGVS